MRRVRIAKTEEGLALLDSWHQRFSDRLSLPHRTVRVDTSFGACDVVITGPAATADQPTGEVANIVLHGAMAGAPHALGELADLPARRSFYAINLPGQSTRADPVHLGFGAEQYPKWLSEVMDGLGIATANLCAVSWGGAVALHFAKHYPTRVAGLVLVVPASVVRGPVLKGILGIALPMIRYRLRPNRKNLEAAFRNLLTHSDDLWLDYLGDAVRHWKIGFQVPPLIGQQDLRELSAPAFVIAAENDLSFPGEQLLRRAERLFPHLVGTHLLEGSCHSPSNRHEDREQLAALINGALESFAAPPRATASRRPRRA